MIEFKNVTFQHHYDDFPLLQNASFTLEKGQNTLLCDVQSGKTTICKLILGLLKPQSGEVFVDGADVADMRPDVLWLPAEPTFFENKSVRYNLEYPSRVRKILPQQTSRIAQLAERFSLEEWLSVKVKRLPLEKRRQLALARGLSVLRKVVLFDGFFDNNQTDCFENVANSLFAESETVAQLTAFPQKAVGRTVIVADKKCVFEGDAENAHEFAKSLLWLSESEFAAKS